MVSLLEAHAKNNQLNHGYLLVGDFDAASRAAREAASVLLGREGKELDAHPDFSRQDFNLLGIKESHELKKKSLLRPFLGGKKVFVIRLFSLTTESANALLKLFEEPPEGTHFFVIAPSEDAVMPTLRSRLTVVEFKKEKEKNEYAAAFLNALPNERMDMIKKIGKDKEKAIELLNGLETALAEAFSVRAPEGVRLSAERVAALEEIGKMRTYLAGRSPSVKMILEHIALVLPKMIQ